ncbi:MAG: efflux RND transporter periplasmic adaptor subunit [Pirellulaceae bacterium]|nr:efflux RND transporter periplasmic adaptor subunit [Pirellulaceae bacterium]
MVLVPNALKLSITCYFQPGWLRFLVSSLVCSATWLWLVGPSRGEQTADLSAQFDLPGATTVENALLKSKDPTRVCSEASGIVQMVAVREGEHVTVGQNVAMIDDKLAKRQLAQAIIIASVARIKFESEIDAQLAENRSRVAKNELDRAIAANAKIRDAYPLKEIDRLNLVFETTQLEIQRAVHDRKLSELEFQKALNEQANAEELVARHRVTAPAGGVVISVGKRPGEWVESGAELCQVMQLDHLIVEGFVQAATPSKLVGRQAVVGVRLGEQELFIPAHVTCAFPEVNPLTNHMRIQLEIVNLEGALVPGLRVRAALVPVP